MADHTYRIRYSVKPGEFAKADIPAGDGGCDAILVASIVRSSEGSVSYAFLSRDGETGSPLSVVEQFKAWSMLAHELAEDPELSERKRAIARDAFERVRAIVLGGRG